jgi:hypothetical protein
MGEIFNKERGFALNTSSPETQRSTLTQSLTI